MSATPPAPTAIVPKPEVLTFDCYGTLIDWERGILDALRPLLGRHGVHSSDQEILDLFAKLESALESGPYLPYRDILERVVVGFGERLGFEPPAADLAILANSVPAWPPFPDTADALTTLKRGYKLAIVSNVDDDLFVETVKHFPIRFDWVITAQQAQSYKPSLRIFEVALRRIGVPRRRVLHVAQSIYHDVAPASRRGIRTVWVNRRSGREGFGATPPAAAVPDFEVPDLATLVEALGT